MITCTVVTRRTVCSALSSYFEQRNATSYHERPLILQKNFGAVRRSLFRTHSRWTICSLSRCRSRPPSHADSQAVNHGIPEELLHSVVSKGREMFDLPKTQKAKFKVHYPCPGCMLISPAIAALFIVRVDGVRAVEGYCPVLPDRFCQIPYRQELAGGCTYSLQSLVNACFFGLLLHKALHGALHSATAPQRAAISSPSLPSGFLAAAHATFTSSVLTHAFCLPLGCFCFPWLPGFGFQRTATNARGWYDDELTKQTRDWKEGFDVGHVPHPGLPPDHPSNIVVEGFNQWPGEVVPLFKVRESSDIFW